MSQSTIYRPYARLVQIRLLGQAVEVPENNLLLRCFQYVAPGIPYGPFCWNGDCENDRVRILEGGSERDGLACQTLVKEGMQIAQVSPELARILCPALKALSSPAEALAGAASDSTEDKSR